MGDQPSPEPSETIQSVILLYRTTWSILRAKHTPSPVKKNGNYLFQLSLMLRHSCELPCHSLAGDSRRLACESSEFCFLELAVLQPTSKSLIYVAASLPGGVYSAGSHRHRQTARPNTVDMILRSYRPLLRLTAQNVPGLQNPTRRERLVGTLSESHGLALVTQNETTTGYSLGG